MQWCQVTCLAYWTKRGQTNSFQVKQNKFDDWVPLRTKHNVSGPQAAPKLSPHFLVQFRWVSFCYFVPSKIFQIPLSNKKSLTPSRFSRHSDSHWQLAKTLKHLRCQYKVQEKQSWSWTPKHPTYSIGLSLMATQLCAALSVHPLCPCLAAKLSSTVLQAWLLVYFLWLRIKKGRPKKTTDKLKKKWKLRPLRFFDPCGSRSSTPSPEVELDPKPASDTPWRQEACVHPGKTQRTVRNAKRPFSMPWVAAACHCFALLSFRYHCRSSWARWFEETWVCKIMLRACLRIHIHNGS